MTKYLFRPMEIFLCNGDPEIVFQQLKERECPSQICGKVFKNGEPTYSCRYVVLQGYELSEISDSVPAFITLMVHQASMESNILD